MSANWFGKASKTNTDTEFEPAIESRFAAIQAGL
jgi:hypothetical protein